MKLFEILIPTHYNNGESVNIKDIETFENNILNISNGFSKLPNIDGCWIDNGITYKETITPYRIVCTKSEIETLANDAKTRFDQLAIFVAEIGQATFY